MPIATSFDGQGRSLHMNQPCTGTNMEGSKYFLLWIALWVVALLVLLPALGQS